MTLSNAMNQQCRQREPPNKKPSLPQIWPGRLVHRPSKCLGREAANGGIILSSWLARSDKKNTTSENAPRKGACSARSLHLGQRDYTGRHSVKVLSSSEWEHESPFMMNIEVTKLATFMGKLTLKTNCALSGHSRNKMES